MDRMLMMLARMVMRRLMNIGINKGIDMASGWGRKPDEAGAPRDPDAARRARETTRRARDALRMVRRIGRM